MDMTQKLQLLMSNAHAPGAAAQVQFEQHFGQGSK